MSEKTEKISEICKPKIKQLPWLLHWWWLIQEPPESGLRGFNKRESWCVVYDDPSDIAESGLQKSYPMPYGSAVNYAKIFNGHIERVEREIPLCG